MTVQDIRSAMANLSDAEQRELAKSMYDDYAMILGRLYTDMERIKRQAALLEDSVAQAQKHLQQLYDKASTYEHIPNGSNASIT